MNLMGLLEALCLGFCFPFFLFKLTDLYLYVMAMVVSVCIFLSACAPCAFAVYFPVYLGLFILVCFLMRERKRVDLGGGKWKGSGQI